MPGGRARNQHFTLDGGNVTNAVGLTRPQQMTSLPMDAMQEFRVISNSYSAENGHSTGGIISLSTRSGTGAPFTVTTLANTTNAFSAGPQRPNLAGDPKLRSEEQTLQRWFNTDAFRNPPLFQFGDAPRSVLRGPFQQTVDITIAKEFALTERYRADLRGEFYNAFNHANFDVPGHTLGAPDFGAILSTRPQRTVQLGLRFSF